MLSGLFSRLVNSPSVLDTESKYWLMDAFIWAVNNFDKQQFLNHSQLVLPNNAFYPGRVSSVQDMAERIFVQTVSLAGMQHWPITLALAPPQQPLLRHGAEQRLQFTGSLRGEQCVVSHHSPDFESPATQSLTIYYKQPQVNQPQDMIASLVQQLAILLLPYRQTALPGGDKLLSASVDVIACVLGFGVIFSNTAYQFKGGCGSCYNPMANRQALLTENDNVFLLALYCQVKSIPYKQASRHLKPHMRTLLKRAVKELERIGVVDFNSLENLRR
ncbi:hypothetical protein QWY77_07105 [Thalassotalea ponticola]|uniref:hypothetical protein n=1 Tax=Thalassotalea ponticola TaxID=1523392 RepID=UPI0025B3510E|nr:hypothetical protein [Thalassotalea ponticola]MDN3652531.1 hypothetical protein [Thalassotalea ponticola]